MFLKIEVTWLDLKKNRQICMISLYLDSFFFTFVRYISQTYPFGAIQIKKLEHHSIYHCTFQLEKRIRLF